jgi:hypothetical protein
MLTSQELQAQIERHLGEVDIEVRQAWARHPCTEALLYLLELTRMTALEMAEEGPPPEEMRQAIYQAQLAKSLREDLLEFVVNVPEEENDV